MKVMHFIHGLNTGGAETLVKNYALLLDNNKFEVVILCFNHYKDSPYEKILEDNRIRVIYASDYMKLYGKKGLIFKIINHIQLYFVIKMIIHKENPDILHTHLQINKYVKFARPSKDTKIFYTLHGELQRYRENDSKDFRVVKWLIKNYNMKIICLHKEMQEEVNSFLNTENTIVLNNGVDLSKFKNVKSRVQIQEELKIPENSFVIGHVGRFSKVKNHDFLVEVFKKIHDTNNNAFLLMIGDGEEKEIIIKKLNSYNLNNNYLILSNRKDIPDLLNAMDIFIFPSISEGLGIALIEAQEAHLPCVVSENIPDGAIISNLVTKISLNVSPNRWADMILNTKSPQKIELNDQNWDIKKIIKKLEKLYLSK